MTSVLPAAHRLHRSSEFTSVVRGGDRFGTRTVVLHHRPELPVDAGASMTSRPAVVGGSVVRHRVSRRLRAVLSERVAQLPAGSGTVVRALPPAGAASSRTLAADVDRALARRAARP